MPPNGGWEIVAGPSESAVEVGTDVQYELKQVEEMFEAPGTTTAVQWWMVNDRNAALEKDQPLQVEGPWQKDWWRFKQTLVGHHTIFASIVYSTSPDNKIIVEYPQWVDTTEALLGAALKAQASTTQVEPAIELSATERYADVLRKDEERMPILKPADKKRHDKKLASLDNYAAELKERLHSTRKCTRFDCHAVHIDRKSQRKTDLRVFISRVVGKQNYRTWHLVDWTNAAVRELTGVYEGSGGNDEDAIVAAIHDWNVSNRYPDGTILMEISKVVYGTGYTMQFETNGASYWDSVASFLDKVAFGATIIAGVVTLLIPEPGSKVVSAAIWTTIFSSTTAGIINIGQRWDEGCNNFKDDAFDGLTILGSVLGGVWARCAKVSINTTRTGAETYVLMGKVGTDGAQGVLVVATKMVEYDSIMSNASLTPEQRAKKLLDLFAKFALDGSMIFVSLRGTKTDLDNLKAGHIDTAKLEQLKDPTATVKLDEPPKVKGDTEDGKLLTKKQDEQVRDSHNSPFPAKTDPPPPPKFPPSIPATKRGMRARDSRTLAKMARDNGQIIMVRNSNENALKWMSKNDDMWMPPEKFLPKPEELKEKTLKSGKYAGLAGLDAADPAFAQKKLDLEKQGYKVDTEHGNVILDANGNAFYSDYDLHGVYKDNNPSSQYNESFKNDANKGFGGKPQIQHGPQDDWPYRLKTTLKDGSPNKNYGPQPPVTAYTPDGRSVHLADNKALKEFYDAHGLDWDAKYGTVEWDKYKELTGKNPP